MEVGKLRGGGRFRIARTSGLLRFSGVMVGEGEEFRS